MPITDVRATVVITPRERFGVAMAALETLLKTIPPSVTIVYVSGRTPEPLLTSIDERLANHYSDARIIHLKCNRLLSPNEARNAGAALAEDDHIVFIDNDVFCAEGWLEALLDCASETNADVVAPLTCQGLPLHTVVHQAGGQFAPDPRSFFATPMGQREIVEVMHDQTNKVTQADYRRAETQLCEFHCALVRRSTFEKVGRFDESMLATKEHLDFCMSVLQAGGKVVFEPRSVVTYLYPNRDSPMTVDDWPYFLVRWSPEWQRRSLNHFKRKWGLKDDGYVKQRNSVRDWRLNEGIVNVIVRKMPVIKSSSILQKACRQILRPIVRIISRILVARDDRHRQRPAIQQTVTQLSAP